MTDRPTLLMPAPEGYTDWLAELKTRIHSAQQRAALAVNRELVLLYWHIGRDILDRQSREGWGAKVVDRLSRDLRDGEALILPQRGRGTTKGGGGARRLAQLPRPKESAPPPPSVVPLPVPGRI